MNKVINLHYRTGMELIKKGVSDDALAIYISLRSLYNSNMEEQLISADCLYYQLFNKFIKRREEYKWIKSALYELEKIELISISEELSNQYVIDMTGLNDSVDIQIDKEEIDPFTNEVTRISKENVNNYFYTIDLDQIQKVLEDNGNKKAIIRYYFMYLGLRAENKGYYFMISREELADRTTFDIRSIDKYNKILSDNKLIYVVHYENYKYSDTKRTLNNLYTVYKEQEIVETNKSRDEFLKEHLADGSIYKSKSYANKGKDTKEYKEKLAQQQEDKGVTKCDTLTTDKKHFGNSTVFIDVINTEPSEEELNIIEQEEKKKTVSNSTPYEWWIDMIQNDNLDMSQRIELAHKFDCEYLLDGVQKIRKQHEMLTFD